MNRILAMISIQFLQHYYSLTSIEGMEHEICRSGPPSPSDSIASSSVIQFELSITCAGSCPVARKTAATMLAACALLPRVPKYQYLSDLDRNFR